MTTKVTFDFVQYRGPRSPLKKKKQTQDISLIVVQLIVFAHQYEWSQLLYVYFFKITSSVIAKDFVQAPFTA